MFTQCGDCRTHLKWELDPCSKAYGKTDLRLRAQLHLQVLRKIEDLGEDDEPNPAGDRLVSFSKTAVFLASATVYECSIYSASKLGGVQRKKSLAPAATVWKKNINDITDDSIDTAPATWLHPASWALSHK